MPKTTGVTLRPATLQSISLALHSPPRFRVGDFQIQNLDGDRPKIKITYVRPEYWLEAMFTSDGVKGTSRIFYKSSPGEYTTEHSETLEDINALLGRIRAWLDRIAEDMQALPFQRQVESRMTGIESLISSLGAQMDVNESFTEQEIEGVKQRLDELEEKLAAQINDSQASESIRDREISELHAEIEHLKEQMGALNKSQWVRVIVSHLFRWLSKPENQQLLVAAVKTGEKLLHD